MSYYRCDKKSIFILGASRLQIPAIKKAKEKGLYVYALDYDPYAEGIEYADKFLEISTIDTEAVYTAALRYKPDFIATSTSDMPVRTVSWVCEKLGKRTDISYEGAVYATDKIEMRKRMKQENVPIPDFYEVSSYEELLEAKNKISDPFVLKPADNAASRGVVLVDSDRDDLKDLYDYSISYSRSGRVLVEEFMDGPEVSVEAFSIEGQPHIIAITDKIITEKPYFVELGHTQPSRLNREQQEDISRVAYLAINAIGMQNGPTHTEIKVTKNGAKLVEIAARLGGDCITSHLVPMSTGVDMIDCSISSLLGENINVDRRIERGAAIRFIRSERGMITGIDGISEAEHMRGVKEIRIYMKPGDVVCGIKNSNDRVGHVIATGEDADEASYNAEVALAKIRIKMK